MGTTLSSLAQIFKPLLFWSKGKECRILMLGLDSAGKTSILYKLQLGQVISTIPTIGFNVESIQYKGIQLNVWDLGGQTSIRPYWRCYYANTQAIVYVVDSTDEERLSTSRSELMAMLSEDELKDAILLVFANKQDSPKALKPEDISLQLGLDNLKDRSWTIRGSSAIKDDHNGLNEGFDCGLAAATTALSASVNAYTIISGSYNSTLTTYEFNQDDNSLSFGKKLNVPHGFAPSWITESPANDSMILVASETNPGRLASTIAESVDKFHTINDHHSGGDGPASSGFTNDGHYALAANYASGSIQAYAFDNNGNLNKLGDTYKLSGSGPNKERQSQPHPHHVVASTLDERTVYIPDLGADYIRQFAIKDEKLIQVQEHKAPSGSGPRHAVFHPELPVLYVVTELSNEILVYEVDESNGFLKLSSQISILPPSKKDKKSMQASEISISGDGKYVYAANRDVKPNDANDVDHLAILEVSNGGKELNVKEHKECGGIQPRAFILFGANEEFLIIGNTFKDAPNVVVFKRDVNSGSIDQVAKIDGQSPTSFVWLAEH